MLKTKPSQSVTRGRVAGFIGAFVAIGGVVVLVTHAAGPLISVEPEVGSLSSGATSQAVAGASGGRAVTFGPGATANQVLPFTLASQSMLKGSPKKVFAHYMSNFIISLDNKDPSVDYYTKYYLNPHPDPASIEAGHAAYGGFIRERPLPRPVDSSPNWQINDAKTDVTRATQSGLDGFAVDILSLTGANWDHVTNIITAAHEVDPNFRIMLEPDAATSTASDVNLLASKLASVANQPAVFHLDDKRLVLTAFRPELQGAAWWGNLLSILKTTYGVDVAFVPTFLNYGASVDSFASICYGFGNWGSRNPATNQNLAATIADAHTRGKIWMQPVSVQDERPKSGVYDEAANTETLRATWNGAIAGADWVQMATWNDYSESSEFEPSTHIGWSPLDISAYYLSRFKAGTYPAINKDVLYVSHRVQPFAARPTGDQTQFQNLRAGSTPARDTVEVLSFLTAPATVKVTVGLESYSYDAPAGQFAQTYPLGLGAISAQVVRAGVMGAKVTSPLAVVTTPEVQDLQYHFASSSR